MTRLEEQAKRLVELLNEIEDSTGGVSLAYSEIHIWGAESGYAFIGMDEDGEHWRVLDA
jgi:hypothetical protein